MVSEAGGPVSDDLEARQNLFFDNLVAIRVASQGARRGSASWATFGFLRSLHEP